MNCEHLGDALDHWKGSVISILRGHRPQLIRGLGVIPMRTDAPWKAPDRQTYARLLNVKVGDICQQDVAFANPAKKRDLYFADLPKDRDLFLDPDTGIAIRGNRHHIRIEELDRLLNSPKKDGRVLMVYQHAAQRQRPHQRFIEIAGQLKSNIDKCHVLVYECSQVAMFFISRNKGRIQGIEKVLHQYLKGTAERRVWDP